MVSELFFAKFLEFLMTELLEIGTFLQNKSVSIFQATAHVLHLAGSFNNKNQRIAMFFASLPYLARLL